MESLSKKLTQKLTLLEEYKSAKNIMIFYPLKDEVDLLPLMKDKTKNFYLPKIEGENLVCCSFKEGEETCLSCFKTCEPKSKPCDKSLIDMVIVPALAVDKNGYRLGYGKGFYDRFLKDFSGIKAVCIPSELIVDDVFHEEHDVKTDMIITEI